MNNTRQFNNALPYIDHHMVEGGSVPGKQRVRQRANGVGDEYIETAPMRTEYNHQYTYKTFTPMFIFVIVAMVMFYFGVV